MKMKNTFKTKKDEYECIQQQKAISIFAYTGFCKTETFFAKPDGMAVRFKVCQTINEDDFFSFLFLGIRWPLLGIVSSLSDPVVV